MVVRTVGFAVIPASPIALFRMTPPSDAPTVHRPWSLHHNLPHLRRVAGLRNV
jgi:hypothetical protein